MSGPFSSIERFQVFVKRQNDTEEAFINNLDALIKVNLCLYIPALRIQNFPRREVFAQTLKV